MNKRYFGIYFGVYLIIFFMIDALNRSLVQFYLDYGLTLSLLNISLTIVMAGLSAYLLSLSHMMFTRNGFKTKGENLSYLAVFFGILTYGCTPCVIAFFASIGISFSVVVLPFGGMPYKILALGLILFGIYWSHRDLNRISCAIGGKNI